MNEKEIRDIRLDDIIPNRFQPRELFNEEALKELSESIKEHGVIQPIIVRPVGDKFEIIAGERRYKASTIAHKETIPCIVRNLDDVNSSKVALLENLQRKDLTPIEEARTYQTIIKISGQTQAELAKSLGKSQSAIANKMRLLLLDEEVQEALLEEKISERHARSLLNIEDKVRQKELLKEVIDTRMTVKDLDDMIKEENNPSEAKFLQTHDEIKEDPILEDNAATEKEFLKSYDKIQEEIKDLDGLESKLELHEFKPDTLKPLNDDVFAEKEEIESLEPVEEEHKQESTYDVRFAINNIRQAIQSTEKFGFKVASEEFDFDDKYQIVIKIDKNK